MRRAALLVAVLVVGCAPRATSGPAWPKMADKETDGGESLTPREGATSVAAASDDADQKVVAATVAATPTPAAATAATPAVTPTVTAPEDTIMVEEIVIEIDD